MNKSRYITILTALTLAMTAAAPNPAVAENNAKPIIWIVLDTSGSMNTIFDPNHEEKNETRLTSALGELIGTKTFSYDSNGKLERMDKKNAVGSDEFSFPDWECPSGSSSCGYNTNKKKTIRYSETVNGESIPTEIAKLGDNPDGKNGIIQAYQSIVKFGFAGMAVGNEGSGGENKDSPIVKLAEAAGGAVKDVALRFTMVWEEDASKNYGNTDLDAHCCEYSNASSNSCNYHIYYGNRGKSSYGGRLDIDVTQPQSNGKSHPSYRGGSKVGIENIYYKDTSRMQTGNVFEFRVLNYRVHGITTNGFRGQVAFRDKDNEKCEIIYKVESTKDFTSSNDGRGSSWNNYSELVARVEYLGSNEFKILDDKSGYLKTTKISNSGGKPVNIYGFTDSDNLDFGKNHNSNTDILKGRTLPASIYSYKKPSDCSKDLGMWNSSIEADAPLVYPTVSDNEFDVIASNETLIKKVRTYQATASTPIGEVLADLYFMFGLDDFTKADEGLVRQQNGRSGTYLTDDYYSCRDKSVIFISDGAPSGSGIVDNEDYNVHGHADKVWIDAYNLYKGGVKVYVIGYAEFFAIDPETGAKIFLSPKEDYEDKNSKGKRLDVDTNNKMTDLKRGVVTLNKMAWKGGTCYDEKGSWIDPNNQEAYDTFIEAFPTHHKYCFINASDGNALRTAMTTAITRSLDSIISKTNVATSTAIGIKTNNGNNGYYNVYSGYGTNLGTTSQTYLNRTSTVCGNVDGEPEFMHICGQDVDMAQRLKCRLTNCDLVEENEHGVITVTKDGAALRAGYIKDKNKACLNESDLPEASTPPKPCATDEKTECLDKRIIFTGDYSTDRYAIRPKIVPLNSTETDIIGTIANSVRNDTTNTWENANFFTNDPANKASVCDMSDPSSEYQKNIASYRFSTNYTLSPYECSDDYDCGTNGGASRYCDHGRCKDGYPKSCQSLATNEICIDGYAYVRNDACRTHKDCFDTHGVGYVCHAGACTPGTVTSCDVRSFIATNALGSIEYATPVIVGSPIRSYRGNGYVDFSKRYWNRDTMLYAPANDGMLHAFVLGKNSADGIYKGSDYPIDTLKYKGVGGIENDAYEEGDELWAFMPQSVVAKARNLPNSDNQKYINATPVTAEVTAPTTYLEEICSSEICAKNNSRWRTVLVGGFRDGGRGYYALDITNPAQPHILWEITPSWQPVASASASDHKSVNADSPAIMTDILEQGDKTDSGYPFMQLGYSYGEPLIVNANINGIREPIAILPGGTNLQADVNDHTGNALYFVRLFPKTPKDLLVKILHFENAITGTPAVYPSSFSAEAQKIYIGDAKGKLYRINIDKTSPADWHSEETYTSAEGLEYQKAIFEPTWIQNKSPETNDEYQPIYQKPAVALYSRYLGYPIIQIAFGTGSNNNFAVGSGENNYIANFYDIPVGDGKYVLNSIKTPPMPKPRMLVFNQHYSSPIGGNVVSGTLSGDRKFEFLAYTQDPVTSKDGTNAILTATEKMTGAPIIYNFDAYYPAYVADTSKGSKSCETGSARIYKLGALEGEEVPKHETVKGDSSRVQNFENLSFGGEAPFTYSSFFDFSKDENGNGVKIYGLKITEQLTCIAGNKSKILAPQLVAQIGTATDTAMKDKDKETLYGKGGTNNLNIFALSLDPVVPQTTQVKWASVYE